MRWRTGSQWSCWSGGLLIGAPKKTTRKLQCVRVLNSAPQIVSNTRKFDRGLTIIIIGTAPSYLAEDCQLVASTDCRQQCDRRPSTRASSPEQVRVSAIIHSPPLVRDFGIACQLIFTSLTLNLGQFRRALETHLFLAAWLRRLVTICFFSAVI